MSTELEALGKEIREKSAVLGISLKRAVMQAIELGGLLVRAKEIAGHGHFLPWLEEKGIAARTANHYMDLFEFRSNTQKLADLTTAYALIEELKAQKKEIAKAVEEEVITPAQAETMTDRIADEFVERRQSEKVEKKKARKQKLRENIIDMAEHVSAPVQSEYSGPTAEKIVEQIIVSIGFQLRRLPRDSQRLEVCHDIVKYLKAKANEYQRESVKA